MHKMKIMEVLLVSRSKCMVLSRQPQFVDTIGLCTYLSMHQFPKDARAHTRALWCLKIWMPWFVFELCSLNRELRGAFITLLSCASYQDATLCLVFTRAFLAPVLAHVCDVYSFFFFSQCSIYVHCSSTACIPEFECQFSAMYTCHQKTWHGIQEPNISRAQASRHGIIVYYLQ